MLVGKDYPSALYADETRYRVVSDLRSFGYEGEYPFVVCFVEDGRAVSPIMFNVNSDGFTRNGTHVVQMHPESVDVYA